MKKTNQAAAAVAENPKEKFVLQAVVSEATKEVIVQTAESYSLPPAVIAGTFCSLGRSLLFEESLARIVKEHRADLVWELISGRQARLTKEVPIVTDQSFHRDAASDAHDLGRPLAVWLGQLIELGVEHRNVDAVWAAFVSLSSRFTAFTSLAGFAASDWGNHSDVVDLMKTSDSAQNGGQAA